MLGGCGNGSRNESQCRFERGVLPSMNAESKEEDRRAQGKAERSLGLFGGRGFTRRDLSQRSWSSP
jgi:hypothetical protein